MIQYDLNCPKCRTAIQAKIDEMTFINNLVKERKFNCGKCGVTFTPQDDHYRGKKIS